MEKVKHEENFSNSPFEHIFRNNKPQHIHFLVHGHFSWFTFDLHLVWLYECFLQETKPWKCYQWSVTMGKWPLTWHNFMVHDVNDPLITMACKIHRSQLNSRWTGQAPTLSCMLMLDTLHVGWELGAFWRRKVSYYGASTISMSLVCEAMNHCFCTWFGLSYVVYRQCPKSFWGF